MDVYLGKKKWNVGYIFEKEDSDELEFTENLPKFVIESYFSGKCDDIAIIEAEYGATFKNEEDVPYMTIERLRKIVENK